MSAKKAHPEIPPEKLALYDKLVATLPHVQRKGATIPYTSWNGHIPRHTQRDEDKQAMRRLTTFP